MTCSCLLSRHLWAFDPNDLEAGLLSCHLWAFDPIDLAAVLLSLNLWASNTTVLPAVLLFRNWRAFDLTNIAAGLLSHYLRAYPMTFRGLISPNLWPVDPADLAAGLGPLLFCLHPGLPLGLRQNVVQHLQQVHRDVSQRFRQLLRTHDTNPPMALISTVK